MKITSPVEVIGILQLLSSPCACLRKLQPPIEGRFACSGRGGWAALHHNTSAQSNYCNLGHRAACSVACVTHSPKVAVAVHY